MVNRTTQLAFEIADSAARCDIEVLCMPVGGEPGCLEEMRTCWFDLERIIEPGDNYRIVIMSAEYLDNRGLLKRHPAHLNWVRPRHINYDLKA
jgi:hypothetical protein